MPRLPPSRVLRSLPLGVALLCAACTGQITDPTARADDPTGPGTVAPGPGGGGPADAPDGGVAIGGDPRDGGPSGGGRPDVGPDTRPIPGRGGEVDSKPNTLVQERLFSCESEPVTYAPPRIWRLSDTQWVRTANDVAGTSGSRVRDPFGFTPSGATFNNYAGAFSVSESQLAGVLRSGRRAALVALGDNKMPGCARSAWRSGRDGTGPSDPLAEGGFTESCQRSTAQWLYTRLVNRDPTDQELDEYVASSSALLRTLGLERGTLAAVTSVFAHPDFLFRSERGAPEPGQPGRVRLTGVELASSLSYTIANQSPFRTRLLNAGNLDPADPGSLFQPDVRAQAVRDLMDVEGRHSEYVRNIENFVLEYFDHGDGAGIQKDGQSLQQWPQNHSRLRHFVEWIIREDVRFVERLLGSPKAFDHTGEDAADDPQRPGILNRRAFLWSHSQNDHNDPIGRGHFVRTELLCQVVPEIPIDVIPQLPDMPDATLRERLADHRESGTSCKACHDLMDPIGLTFEQFDHFGEYRTEEQGRPVDTSGALIGTRTLDRELSGPAQLANALATSPEVERCFIRHLFRYLMGRDETYGDACTLEAAHTAYRTSDGSLRATIEAIMTSDTVLYRAAAEE